MIDAREWALLTWLGIFFIFLIAWPKTRGSLHLILTTTALRIWAVLLILAAWIGGSVYGALEIGLWESELLGETMFWAVGSGLVLMFSVTQELTSREQLQKIVLGVLGLAVVTEVFVNLYVFHYLVELLALPAIVLLAMLSAVAGTKSEYRLVKSVVDFILAIVGLGLTSYVVYQIVDGWNQIDWMGTFRAFALPIWLTLALIPFLYVLRVYVAYDYAFTLVGFEAPNFRVRWRARSAIALKLRLQLDRVAGLRTYWFRKLTGATNLRSAMDILEEFKRE
ncbi:MAG: hypothetical protein IIC91_04820 [Chloroflexi bacterium]|nr:hypothetical protein [Chloroflexota bacterium]